MHEKKQATWCIKSGYVVWKYEIERHRSGKTYNVRFEFQIVRNDEETKYEIFYTIL